MNIDPLLGVVSDEQIDALGHMNFLEYQRLTDAQLARWWHLINGESSTHELNAVTAPTYVTLESHVRYIQELRLGDAYAVTLRIITFDSKKLIALQSILHNDRVACLVESLQVNFDLAIRRAVDFSPRVLAMLGGCATGDGNLATISRRLSLAPPGESLV
jgi:acyl-CoA thioesterase FadM